MTQGAVLVTGGAGYIGSHTVRALRQAGRHVVVVDSLQYGRADAVIDAALVVGDIADRDLIERTCRDHGVESIIHFAAYKNVGESMAHPDRYWNNNVAGTVALAEAVLAAGVERFVFSSSCSVYGTPAAVPVAESAPISPESVYAESKAMVERVLGWYGATHGLRAVSLRYFNAAGASDDGRIGEDWTHTLNLIPVAMKAVILGHPKVEVFGTDYPTPDGSCVRDYVHVEDLAEAHVRAVDYLDRNGATIAVNVGTGVGTSVLEVLRATELVAGRDVPHVLGPRRTGDPITVFADPTYAATTLGWQARRGLREIIESAYRWHTATA